MSNNQKIDRMLAVAVERLSEARETYANAVALLRRAEAVESTLRDVVSEIEAEERKSCE
ncbi:MAG: hypothetical protein WC120_05240 [Parcubacteria group bacterium]|jgi:uncharacterized protein Yka (UPF0111/DUF47 family)